MVNINYSCGFVQEYHFFRQRQRYNICLSKYVKKSNSIWCFKAFWQAKKCTINIAYNFQHWYVPSLLESWTLSCYWLQIFTSSELLTIASVSLRNDHSDSWSNSKLSNESLKPLHHKSLNRIHYNCIIKAFLLLKQDKQTLCQNHGFDSQEMHKKKKKKKLVPWMH